MIHKIPICPERIRNIPEQFSWVDRRLVRTKPEGHKPEGQVLFLDFLPSSRSKKSKNKDLLAQFGD